jgi:hypothetical protein
VVPTPTPGELREKAVYRAMASAIAVDRSVHANPALLPAPSKSCARSGRRARARRRAREVVSGRGDVVERRRRNSLSVGAALRKKSSGHVPRPSELESAPNVAAREPGVVDMLRTSATSFA